MEHSPSSRDSGPDTQGYQPAGLGFTDEDPGPQPQRFKVLAFHFPWMVTSASVGDKTNQDPALCFWHLCIYLSGVQPVGKLESYPVITNS